MPGHSPAGYPAPLLRQTPQRARTLTHPRFPSHIRPGYAPRIEVRVRAIASYRVRAIASYRVRVQVMQ